MENILIKTLEHAACCAILLAILVLGYFLLRNKGHIKVDIQHTHKRNK